MREALTRGARRTFWSLLVPASAALVAMRYLVPPPLEGAPGGVVAAVGRFADDHPLAVGLALFIALSLAVRYWRERLGGVEALPARGRGARRHLVGWVAAAAVAALAIRSSVAEIYRVVSGSMEPTLVVGDRLLVDKLAYGVKLPFTRHRVWQKLPRRGDVIVFDGGALPFEKLPGDALVKRVVGLPGDRIAFEGDSLVVNGARPPICDAGPYAAPTGKQSVRGRLVVEDLGGGPHLALRPVGGAPLRTFVVPPGEVFVVGDDRVASSDSRTWGGGQGAGVPLSAIEGRVTRRLDHARLLAPLVPHVRQPGVDTERTEGWIAECLRKPR